jgi:hypothetical protein
MWLFAFVWASPMIFLLAGSKLGGSDRALALLATYLGACAVYLSGRTHRFLWRAVAAVVSMAAGTAAVLAVETLATPSHSLLVQAAVGAAAVPVLCAYAMHKLAPFVRKSRSAVTVSDFPTRTTRAYVILVVLAVVQLVMNLPAPKDRTPPTAAVDWAERSGLRASSEFGFIARFVGPGATMTRFEVPDQARMPSAAVDVISTKNLAALRDFAGAVWYPSSSPVSPFVPPANTGDVIPIRALSSDISSVNDPGDAQWFTMSWVWRVGDEYQQVTVVVSQNEALRPPDPRPLTLTNTLLDPAVWVARQQPGQSGPVDQWVLNRAAQITGHLLRVAELTHA